MRDKLPDNIREALRLSYLPREYVTAMLRIDTIKKTMAMYGLSDWDMMIMAAVGNRALLEYRWSGNVEIWDWLESTTIPLLAAGITPEDMATMSVSAWRDVLVSWDIARELGPTVDISLASIFRHFAKQDAK